MLLKPRASVSSEVNGRTRGLWAADAQAQGTLEETASVSVCPRARHCPVLTEFAIPLGRRGECFWVKGGTQASPCVRASWSGALGTTRSGPEGVVRRGWGGGLNTRVCVQGFPLNGALAFDA